MAESSVRRLSLKVPVSAKAVRPSQNWKHPIRLQVNDDDTPSFLRKTIATAVKGNEVGLLIVFYLLLIHLSNLSMSD